mmetsp:Transcript_162081/g.393690  ORF Transcript_162081/g.393690 Transcript_162081/m.393690 type:complete len:82 (-) Transcript_162081:742-987(-)
MESQTWSLLPAGDEPSGQASRMGETPQAPDMEPPHAGNLDPVREWTAGCRSSPGRLSRLVAGLTRLIVVEVASLRMLLMWR